MGGVLHDDICDDPAADGVTDQGDPDKGDGEGMDREWKAGRGWRGWRSPGPGR